MPSKTPKQARTMAAAAHDPEFAAKMGIPQDVARDFNLADKGGTLRKQKHMAGLIRKPRGAPTHRGRNPSSA